MDIAVFAPAELELVLRALVGVARANGTFTLPERDFVEAVARIHGSHVDPAELAPVAPEAVAAGVRDPQRRKRVVQLAIVTALVEGEPPRATEEAVVALARALDMDEAGLRVLRDVAHGHSLLARFDMGRRIRDFMTRVDTFPGLFKVALTAVGATDDVVAARYQALATRPVGSFGRALYDHFREHHFPLPGERRGFPDGMLFHDVGHVLSGYGVDPEGEIQQAAFQAGFCRRDGFVFLLFGVLQFHAGLQLTPVARPQRGLFDTKKVLRALERGAACSVDLSDGAFNLWDYVEMPLEEMRARLGVPPLAA